MLVFSGVISFSWLNPKTDVDMRAQVFAKNIERLFMTSIFVLENEFTVTNERRTRFTRMNSRSNEYNSLTVANCEICRIGNCQQI